MSSDDSDFEYRAYQRDDRRHRYRSHNKHHGEDRHLYRDDDDEDEEARSLTYDSQRNRQSRHRRRRGYHNNYQNEHYAHGNKARRSGSWYSYLAARIMAACLLLSFVAYEISILRAPFMSDAFHPVAHENNGRPPGKPAVRVPNSLSGSSQQQSSSSLQSKTEYSSSNSFNSPSSKSFDSSSGTAEQYRSKNDVSVEKRDSEQSTKVSENGILSTRSSTELPADADVELSEKNTANNDENKSNISNDRETASAENPAEYHPLRRRRRSSRPDGDREIESSSSSSETSSSSSSESYLKSSSKSATGSASKSSSASATDNDEGNPISALKINVGAADIPADSTDNGSLQSSSSSETLSDTNDNVSAESETKSKSSSSENGSHGNRENESKDSASSKTVSNSGLNSANKGSEPGAGENFWQWFQESKGNQNQSLSTTVTCPEDSKRLCTMFFKYLRKYKIRSVYDVSCGKNLEWMPEVLKTAGGELWGFKYYCSSTDESEMEVAKQKLSAISFVEYVPDAWWKSGFPENIDLLFAWDTLAHIAFGRVWNFFVKARASGIKFILIDNYPTITNEPSPNRQFINLRRHPFKFPSAKEVVQNVTEPGETMKRQLLFYETESLPDSVK